MKKILLFTTLLCALILVSCSSNDNYSISNDKKNYVVEDSKILSEMSNFNDSLISNSATRSHERLLNINAVVWADVVGGYGGFKAGLKIGSFFGHPGVGATVGTLVCGGWCSYQMHRRINCETRAEITSIDKPSSIKIAQACAISMVDEELVDDNMPQMISIDYENMDVATIGAKHNILVKHLENAELVPENELEEYFTEEEMITIKSEELQNTLDSISLVIDKAAVNNEPAKIEETDLSDCLMNLFSDVLTQYPENANDMEFIISKYKEAVENSDEFTDEQKEAIYYSLSIAASSYELWNDEITNE